MIFLSHNYKDKPLVEPIAIKLYEIFGQDNVFYDSWSIQPGDGIVDKMSSGLANCRFFFLFSSKNSLNSNMVKLEWQNALMKAVKGDLRIIPVRLDSSLLPPILLQTLYLDMYSNGFDVTVKQMVEVISGKNTFNPAYARFSNLEAIVTRINDDFSVDICAKYIMEPRSSFLLLLDNLETDITVGIRNSGMMQSGFNPNIALNNGVKGNGWLISVSQATIPGFPFELKITKRNPSVTIKLLAILHETSKNNWGTIPVILKNS